MSYNIEYSFSSNVGVRRSQNQDNFCIMGNFMPEGCIGTNGTKSGKVNASENSLFAIFDGMGGEERGEAASFIASSMAANTDFSPDVPSAMFSFIARANRKICDFAKENMLRSSGSTAAMLIFDEKIIHLCNIGDSKIIRITKSGAEQISVDHLANARPGRKAPLSQCLGIPEDEMKIIPNVSSFPVSKDDKYLICSDGLTDMVSLDEIGSIVLSNGTDEAVGKLIERALENGGKDNVTVCLCKITDFAPPFRAKEKIIIGVVALIVALLLSYFGYCLVTKLKDKNEKTESKPEEKTEAVVTDKVPVEANSDAESDETEDTESDTAKDTDKKNPSEIFDVPSDMVEDALDGTEPNENPNLPVM